MTYRLRLLAIEAVAAAAMAAVVAVASRLVPEDRR